MMKKKDLFRFKQFEINQENVAMKVGTDGVLLGAWANLYSGNKILDIGTGTGLIALMLAQRFNQAEIDAIEIEEDAFLQAKHNIEDSKFCQQIKIKNIALQNYFTEQKYDLIVSNPPFFKDNRLMKYDARKQARQQETLTFDELITKTSYYLSKEGRACFIIPFDQKDKFCRLAEEQMLKLNKVLYVKGNPRSPIKRTLLEFSFMKNSIQEGTLVVEKQRHQYTKSYIELTKEFYLKM